MYCKRTGIFGGGVYIGGMARARQSIRLREYDYPLAGAYFVTICTHNREHLFGEIHDGQMHLSEHGIIVRTEWYWTEVVRPNIWMDSFVIMPNHIHGIVAIRNVGATRPYEGGNVIAGSLGAIMGQFKSPTTKQINSIRGTPEIKVWQRSYYERILRDEDELNAVRAYIENNPRAWDTDEENVAYSGMFPCLRKGLPSALVESISRCPISNLRVSAGSITSSI